MRTSFLSLLGFTTFYSIVLAAPLEAEAAVLGRAVSPDFTCGGVNQYTCTTGLCCSVNGYCGNTDDYCGLGCQNAFGAACQTQPISSTVCGPNNGGAVCSAGLCCSASGYCGNTADYCGGSCQKLYTGTGATCTNTGSAGTGLCGPQNGNAVCTGGQCCSLAGYCGTGNDYCSDPNNCAPGYGVCDSDATPTGPTTANAPRPLLGSVTYDDDIYDCTVNNVVALTYDDGPYIYTSQLLDILKSYGFTATFFITGNNNGKGQIDIQSPYPDLIRRMVAEGHQLASHTWSHYSLDNSTSAMRKSQMVKLEMAFNNLVGKWPTYMRPPYSQCVTDACRADMKALGYHITYFDLDTQDYLNPLPSQVQNSKDIVKAYMADKTATDYLSIQHDIGQQSVTNLSSYYFDLIKARGWKGVTVGACLGDDQKNWYRSLSSSSTSSTTTSRPISTSTTLSTTTTRSASSSTTTTTTRASSSTTVASSSSTTSPTTTRTTTVASSSTTSPTTTRTTTVASSSTTSPTTTQSTTVSPTTTTTSRTTTTTTTTRATTTTTTTTTSRTTSAAPSSTTTAQTCDVKVQNFCGNIDNFSTMSGCYAAGSKCNTDGQACTKAYGVLSCLPWSNVCTRLNATCWMCLFGNCNKSAFL